MVRDEHRKKNEQTSSTPSAPPTYYHHPSSNSSTTDSYSHTANSTAGYSQTNAYPTLTSTYHQERDKQVLELIIFMNYFYLKLIRVYVEKLNRLRQIYLEMSLEKILLFLPRI